MKILNNIYVNRIQGYLNALDDISGGQREFSTVVSLISSETTNIVDEIYLCSKNINIKDIQILKQTSCKYCTDSLFKILLLPKAFSGLYPPYNEYYIPNNILKPYLNYIISHLQDFIDFAFGEEGLNTKEVIDKQIEVLLIKNQEEYLIILSIQSKNIKFFIFFF